MRHSIFAPAAVAALSALVGGGLVSLSIPASGASSAAVSVAGPQCEALSRYVGRLGDGVSDLGSGVVVSDEDRTKEALGTGDCPTAAATRCDKLRLISFMLALTDLTPQTYRRPGMSAFLANAEAEYGGMGDGCSAESWNYRGGAVRANFTSLARVFCTPGSPDYANGQAAAMVLPGGRCDTSDAALARLKPILVAQAPASIATRPEYLAGFAPIVARMYRYTNRAVSDEASFRYRGRGFIQITGVNAYRNCQADLVEARSYLSRSRRMAAARTLGVDWATVDVVRDPEVVSRSRVVAAFCAASYWNRNVALSELVGGSPLVTRARFNAMVAAVNAQSSKSDERYPAYLKWCATVQCASTPPRELNFARGFSILLGVPATGTAS